MPTGNINIDFGTAAQINNDASVAVTGQTSILATSDIEAYFMAEASGVGDNDADANIIARSLCDITCGNIVAGTGFTIYATNNGEMTGQFKVRWVWN